MTSNHNIRLQQAVVKFNDEYSINGYKTVEGCDFYVDTTDVSKLLGFPDEWLETVIAEKGKTWKSLYKMQYMHEPLRGFVVGEGGSVKFVNAISIDNFSTIVSYAALAGKKEAIDLQLLFIMKAIEGFIE